MWTGMTRTYRSKQQVATSMKLGYYYPLSLFMALTAKDIWWKYVETSDRNIINILKGTYINQDSFVLNNTVKCLKNKQDIDICLDDVYVFDTPKFEHMWNRRLICATAAIVDPKFQFQIKKLLWEHVKYLNKEIKQLKQQNVSLQKEISVLLFLLLVLY